MKEMRDIASITIEEWNKLEWEDSEIEYYTFRSEELWKRGYSIIGEFIIEGISYKGKEWLYQKDGQMYIERGKMAKVYLENNVLYAGEKNLEEYVNIGNNMFLPEKLDNKIRVRKDGIIFCNKDERVINYLNSKKCEYSPTRGFGYSKSEIKHLDTFKEIANKYNYDIVDQSDRSIS